MTKAGKPGRRKEARFTIGQQAAIYGLVFVGVGYVNACTIVGTSHHTAAHYVDQGYRRLGVNRARRYPDEIMAAVRHAYETTTETIASLERRFGIGQSYLCELAKRQGWQPRRIQRSATSPPTSPGVAVATCFPQRCVAARPAFPNPGRARTTNLARA